MARIEKITCIYHGGCIDGFTAAWCVYRALGRAHTVRFIAGEYQQPPPMVEPDELVLLVDFSYKRPVLLELAKCCLGVVIMDHHATALEDLRQDLDLIYDWSAFDFRSAADQIEEDVLGGRPGRIYTIFDDARSGAGIAWDALHLDDMGRSFMVGRVEDRDLWRFLLLGSHEVHAVLASHSQTFERWDALNMQFEEHELRTGLLREGAAILRAHRVRLEELLPQVTRPMDFLTPDGTLTVPVANLPYIYASEAGDALCDGRDLHGRSHGHPKCVGVLHHPFCATYYDAPGHRIFSLRSRDGGADVGQIAAKYGGGGHKHSAGFRVPRGDDPEEFEHIAYSTWSLMQ